MNSQNRLLFYSSSRFGQGRQMGATLSICSLNGLVTAWKWTLVPVQIRSIGHGRRCPAMFVRQKGPQRFRPPGWINDARIRMSWRILSHCSMCSTLRQVYGLHISRGWAVTTKSQIPPFIYSVIRNVAYSPQLQWKFVECKSISSTFWFHQRFWLCVPAVC